LTQARLNKSLDKACRAVMGIALNDYKRGASFDFLGLEVGQYYVDFLKNRYETDYLYTLVCTTTLRQIRQKHKFTDLSTTARKMLNAVLLSGLSGVKAWREGYSSTTGINHDQLFKEVQKLAFSRYQAHFEKASALNQTVIEETVATLGLEGR
ncbi:hypothetical protein ACPV51_21840, partial [Vibrio astriarenae]